MPVHYYAAFSDESLPVDAEVAFSSLDAPTGLLSEEDSPQTQSRNKASPTPYQRAHELGRVLVKAALAAHVSYPNAQK
jgi:hypothetical protein